MIWRHLNHQNILPFYGVYTGDALPDSAMVSPWMPNGDILDYVHHHLDVDRHELVSLPSPK